MRAAIYGAGSLGTILGAYITKNGGSIELVNRNKAHIEALQKEGAKVIGTMNFTQKVTAYTPDAMSGKYDIIFLMTKQQQNKRKWDKGVYIGDDSVGLNAENTGIERREQITQKPAQNGTDTINCRLFC